MSKKEFLSKLKVELTKYEDKGVEKVVQYYTEIIDDKLEAGMSEREAVDTLGEMCDIVASVSLELTEKSTRRRSEYSEPPREHREPQEYRESPREYREPQGARASREYREPKYSGEKRAARPEVFEEDTQKAPKRRMEPKRYKKTFSGMVSAFSDCGNYGGIALLLAVFAAIWMFCYFTGAVVILAGLAAGGFIISTVFFNEFTMSQILMVAGSGIFVLSVVTIIGIIGIAIGKLIARISVHLANSYVEKQQTIMEAIR